MRVVTLPNPLRLVVVMARRGARSIMVRTFRWCSQTARYRVSLQALLGNMFEARIWAEVVTLTAAGSALHISTAVPLGRNAGLGETEAFLGRTKPVLAEEMS